MVAQNGWKDKGWVLIMDFKFTKQKTVEMFDFKMNIKTSMVSRIQEWVVGQQKLQVITLNWMKKRRWVSLIYNPKNTLNPKP